MVTGFLTDAAVQEARGRDLRRMGRFLMRERMDMPASAQSVAEKRGACRMYEARMPLALMGLFAAAPGVLLAASVARNRRCGRPGMMREAAGKKPSLPGEEGPACTRAHNASLPRPHMAPGTVF